MNDFRPSYAISALAPEEITKTFLNIKEQFNLVYQKDKNTCGTFFMENQAHITLKMPFYLKEGITEESLISKLDTISFQSIEVEAKEIVVQHLETYGTVIELKVKDNVPLKQLHEEICDVIDDISINKEKGFDRDSFHPHMTILYDVPANVIHEANAYINNNIPQIKCKIQSFWVTKNLNHMREKTLLKIFTT